ncbi:GNAT family N-acetyltransferase [Oscillibacter sp.]|uniref:GNAT family N-acetyltransferase n=1 Tax=Oscillibacter sp. TaxID=1945593 RepID=UPI002D807755|nr:GNAT family N-acetyltransferase [Oscillibacter sp.]
MTWTVYILCCGDGTLYTGCTNDLPRRLKAHQSGRGAKYTRSRLPVELAYREETADKSAALQREIAIKHLSRREKLALIAGKDAGTMEIRPLRETDDRLTVSRIYEESWKSAYRGIVPQAYLDGIPAGLWAANLDQGDRQSLVLEKGGRLVGTVCVSPSRWPDYPDFGEIVALYLLPEYMDKGYGKALLTAAVETLAVQGYRDILLWVLEENHRARAFYEKQGFHYSGERMEHAVGGKPLGELLYLRHIE